MTDIAINRRRFLQVASAVAAVSSALSAVPSVAGILTADNKMNALEQQVFQKMLDISLPTKGSSLVDPASLPVIPTIEQALLAGMAPHIRQGLRGGIVYFNDGPKAQYGKTFVQLSDAKAAEFVDAWTRSEAVPHRALAVGLKKLTVLAYWAIPNTWAPLGYDGPVTEKMGVKSLGNTPEPRD
ncbi:MAG: hypothetical protein CMI09_14000 [Oceanospirillaceae bacterium]|nr:hypothetical protein [Oceanospirillaceae bacterium]